MCKLRLRTDRWMVVLGGWLLLGLLAFPAFVTAQQPLPPRPTPTPTPTPTAIPVPGELGGPSALIELRASVTAGADAVAAPDWQGLWTVVEWLDVEGNWQPVEGWRAPFDSSTSYTAQKAWSVPETLFAQGPFRWVVYETAGTRVVGTSENFNFPSAAGGLVIVELVLDATMLTPAAVLLPMTGLSPTTWLLAGWALLALLIFTALLWRQRA